MVKDIFPGIDGSSPEYLINANGSLFFVADDGSHGREMWMYVPSDDCQDAEEIRSPGQNYYGSTQGAAGNDLTSCAYLDSADIWYHFTPQVSGQYTITVTSSEFDTTLAVFNACGGNELVCNDDYNLSTNSQVILDMIKGKNYRIRVAGFGGQTGNYKLSFINGSCAQLTQGDLNGDCVVDFLDFAIMASNWLSCSRSPPDLCWD
jgi:hypothetical protein